MGGYSAVHESGIVIQAGQRGGARGLYELRTGSVRRIIDTEDKLDGKTISHLWTGDVSDGVLLFLAEFSDGKSAFIASIRNVLPGGELEVLEGLRETLRRQRPVVICELLPVYGLEEPIGIFRKDRQDRIERILAEENYRIARIGRDGSLQPLERLEIHSDLTRCDHAFLPGEEAEALLAEISSA